MTGEVQHIQSDAGQIKNEKQLSALLGKYGLRVTHQRLIVATHIFGRNNRLIDASKLYEDIAFSGEDISLATIYNTLHHFTKAGLVRPVASSGQKSFFIINCRNSSFFYYQNGEVIALYGHEPVVQKLPLPPEGFEISHIDVAIHLVKKTGFPNVSGKPVTSLDAVYAR